MHTPGTLVLVATPIGNLGDISVRAAEALKAADIIYCEDTRRSRQLLTHLGIRGQKLASLHEHNEDARVAAVLEQLAAGQMAALVSDTGMPVIADPGRRLVAAVAGAGNQVTAIPGANAALMALAISGLPAERFAFEGFLPPSGSARTRRLEAVAESPQTTILYESPRRVARTLADLGRLCDPDRPVAITRELTKLHEEVWRGTLGAAQEYLDATPPRGEYTLVLGGATDTPELINDDKITTLLQEQLATGASRRSAVDRVTAELGVPRKRVYALALQL